MNNLMQKLVEAKTYIVSQTDEKNADIGLVLGSGLGELAERVDERIVIPYAAIPHFPVSTVAGHKSCLVIGTLEGKRVVCMQGRFHFYEGYSMDQIVFPIQVMHMLGAQNLILTNAAGCVNTAWNAGDLMIITDHIKLIAESPMRGTNVDELGERFFDMSCTYDKALQQLALDCGKTLGIQLRQGVYQYFTGPQYETPAEVRLARMCGADAVGMSTVPEAIAASHMHMHTLGISSLTNMAAGILDTPLNHKDVLEASEKGKAHFAVLIQNIVQRMNAA